jgi:hypothetical protein
MTTATARIRRDAGSPAGYLVESSAGDSWYEVRLAPASCTCKAFQYRSGPCKHIRHVVEMFSNQEVTMDPDEPEEDEPEPFTWDSGEEREEVLMSEVYSGEGTGASVTAPTPARHAVSADENDTNRAYDSAEGDEMSSLPDDPDYTDRSAELAHAAALLNVDDLLESVLDEIRGEWRQTPLSFAAQTLKIKAEDPDFLTMLPAHAESVGKYILGVLCESYGKEIEGIIGRMAERGF